MREIDKLVKHFNTFNTRLPPTRHCIDNSTMHFMENCAPRACNDLHVLTAICKKIDWKLFYKPLKIHLMQIIVDQ